MNITIAYFLAVCFVYLIIVLHVVYLNLICGMNIPWGNEIKDGGVVYRASDVIIGERTQPTFAAGLL
jgi:hypothetical protein